QLRPDVQKAVWHNSLRLPKGESLTAKQWFCIADDYMTRMGFSETHLRCYILHDDENGQHIHIIASRVSLDAGKLYLGR
ncbi:relaxase/mobilization nuclease domain-containing protein, partial [Escherichia coli]